jgi:hypothetical protein
MATDTQQTQIPADAVTNSRDFRIHSISIINSQGISIDITAMTIEIQLRQDLYLGFMNGELMVTDGIDLYSQLVLHGDEYLYLFLSEPGSSVSIKKAFRIYKIGNRTAIVNNAQQYIIYFTSDELIHAQTTKISKAYKSSKISDIANDIMTNWLLIPTNRIKVDTTSDAVDVIIPNYRLSEAMNWLATRAFDTDHSCYFFYENLDGFNFRSLQSIYKDGAINKSPLVFQNKSVDKVLASDKMSIDAFKVICDFDVLSSIGNGSYAMKLLGFDLFNQTLTNNEYNIDGVSKLYENPSINNLKDRAGKQLFDKSDAHLMTYPQTEKTSTDQKNHSESWVKRIMSLAALNNNILEITIPGNMELQVGKTVDVLFPLAVIPTNSSDMWDRRKSGQYLIVAINHLFTMNNQNFHSILMIARDSMPIALPSPDSDLVSKIAKLNNT